MLAKRGTSRRLGEMAIVLVLLASHGWLALSSTFHKSLTFDEVAHLGGGLLAWRGDTRFNAESGVLPQRWATLALRGRDLDVPAPDHPARLAGNVWLVARDVLYGRGNDAAAIARSGRSLAVVWSVVLGAVVYAGSRRLFGPPGALFSLLLYAGSPTILAHGRWVTTDLPAALFFLLACGALWSVLEGGKLRWILMASLAVAGLLLSKHSGLLIVPMAALLGVLHLARAGVSRRALRRVAGAALGVAALTAIWIWGAYGFRYSADPRAAGGQPSAFVHSWDSVLGQGGAAVAAVGLANDLRLLPEAYLWGLAYTLGTTRERDAFLSGRTSRRGWWWFFPYAAAVKTPLALFAVLTLAGALWLRGAGGSWGAIRRGLDRSAPLWVLVAVYGLATMTSSLNIGHRHLLPLYPVAFILAGGLLGGAVRKPRWAAVPAVLLGGWFLWESWRIRPHYLAYFNQLAGGPSNGYRHLVDSSLDWGQDLPALEDWIETFRKHSAESAESSVYVSYFGTAMPVGPDLARPDTPGQTPRIARLGVDWLASYFPTSDYRRPPPPLTGGLYCVSVTLLQSLHLRTLGPWTTGRERELREKEAHVERFRSLIGTVAGNRRLASERSVAEWMDLFREFDRLRCARLFRSLRRREPDGRAGYSIHVYHLSDAEVAAAQRNAVDGVP